MYTGLYQAVQAHLKTKLLYESKGGKSQKVFFFLSHKLFVSRARSSEQTKACTYGGYRHKPPLKLNE